MAWPILTTKCHDKYNFHYTYSFLHITLLQVHDISKMTGKIISLFLSCIPFLYLTPSISSSLLLSQTFYFAILSVFLSTSFPVIHVKNMFLPSFFHSTIPSVSLFLPSSLFYYFPYLFIRSSYCYSSSRCVFLGRAWKFCLYVNISIITGLLHTRVILLIWLVFFGKLLLDL
jgi:hypothetical protein